METEMKNDAAVAWYYEFGDTGEAGPVTFGGDPGKEAIEWAERYGHTLHYLYSATTVAELRAEIECLRVELAGSQERALMVLRAKDDWMERANKAERRMAAAEKLVRKWEESAELHGVRQFTGNDHLLFANELRAALTKETP